MGFLSIACQPRIVFEKMETFEPNILRCKSCIDICNLLWQGTALYIEQIAYVLIDCFDREQFVIQILTNMQFGERVAVSASASVVAFFKLK
jgi:hypothetical protein